MSSKLPQEYSKMYKTFTLLFCIFMVEGKDSPKEAQKGDFSAFGKTTELLLELCRSIFHTGRVVFLDSGFCVLKALIKLREYGVFASAVIKKRIFCHMQRPIGATILVKSKL